MTDTECQYLYRDYNKTNNIDRMKLYKDLFQENYNPENLDELIKETVQKEFVTNNIQLNNTHAIERLISSLQYLYKNPQNKIMRERTSTILRTIFQLYTDYIKHYASHTSKISLNLCFEIMKTQFMWIYLWGISEHLTTPNLKLFTKTELPFAEIIYPKKLIQYLPPSIAPLYFYFIGWRLPDDNINKLHLKTKKYLNPSLQKMRSSLYQKNINLVPE